MSDTTDSGGWIAYLNAHPEMDQLIWSVIDGKVCGPVQYRGRRKSLTTGQLETHWKPAEIPAPPPREPTQEELDAAALNAWFAREDHSSDVRHNFHRCWHDALAWERAQVRGIIEEAAFQFPYIEQWNPYMKRIARRVGLKP